MFPWSQGFILSCFIFFSLRVKKKKQCYEWTDITGSQWGKKEFWWFLGDVAISNVIDEITQIVQTKPLISVLSTHF